MRCSSGEHVLRAMINDMLTATDIDPAHALPSTWPVCSQQPLSVSIAQCQTESHTLWSNRYLRSLLQDKKQTARDCKMSAACTHYCTVLRRLLQITAAHKKGTCEWLPNLEAIHVELARVPLFTMKGIYFTCWCPRKCSRSASTKGENDNTSSCISCS